MKRMVVSGSIVQEIDLTPQEIVEFNRNKDEENARENAFRVAQNKEVAEKIEVKQDPQVQAFLKMAPTEVNTYIDTTVTDLASAKTMLQFFGRMLLTTVRKEYK